MSVYHRFDAHPCPSIVTTNVANRQPLFNSADAAELLLGVIYDVRRETGFYLLAFVIMPDHVHLVVVPPSSFSLAKIMQLIKGRFARLHNNLSAKRGSLWQDRYHERALRDERELAAAIDYVHQNPVAARLNEISGAEGYPWSSASGRHPVDLAVYLGQAESLTRRAD